jgi:hypothetical protein
MGWTADVAGVGVAAEEGVGEGAAAMAEAGAPTTAPPLSSAKLMRVINNNTAATGNRQTRLNETMMI